MYLWGGGICLHLTPGVVGSDCPCIGAGPCDAFLRLWVAPRAAYWRPSKATRRPFFGPPRQNRPAQDSKQDQAGEDLHNTDGRGLGKGAPWRPQLKGGAANPNVGPPISSNPSKTPSRFFILILIINFIKAQSDLHLN
ncbi:hypothetical protein PGTUg99_030855 [Puccinia graminis f. sp. tritici]|uniref:Uncharacterized protein n=1 Tax=Puccinia graminis f. sp. tritici TaxID=56615 RepID=A0A5B0SJK1_PUCGR|nr:hypothetical protein PGTUg99_030855 [Puccinia graminis f. sp. tritici]